MVGKKKLALILSGFLVMTGLISCSNTNTQEGNGSTSESSENAKNDGKMYTIGINQLVQHDALDASREGFVEGLKESGFEEGKNRLSKCTRGYGYCKNYFRSICYI